MSLIESNLIQIITKQYIFKLKEYMGFFTTLAGIQVISLILTSNGTGSMGASSDGISFSIKLFSGSLIIIVTMIWAAIMAMVMTRRNYTDGDFSFVSNRLSSNLANIAFLLTASIIGGLMAILCGITQKAIMYYALSNQQPVISSYSASPLEWITGFSATILYIALFSAIGYCIGKLTQWFKPFIVIIPAVIISQVILDSSNAGEDGSTITNIFGFFITESSFILFLAKIIVTSIILYAISLWITNNKEVRQ